MGSNPINNIIQGLGTLAELWVITFQSFKNQGMDDKTATMPYKGFDVGHGRFALWWK